MECIDCGNTFHKYQWNQKRCYDCIEKTDRRFKARPEKVCLECSIKFQPRVIRQMFCSDACGKINWERGYFRRTYNITREEYLKMFEDQNHRCAICNEEGFKINSKAEFLLCVDHCHSTGKIRGLLCHNCNRALGLLKDNTSRLIKAIKYLEGSETIP
jgi:hypothetical protein